MPDSEPIRIAAAMVSLLVLASGHATAQAEIPKQDWSTVNKRIGDIWITPVSPAPAADGINQPVEDPHARRLSGANAEPLKAQILQQLPKSKPVTVVVTMGDPEAVQFAQDIYSFMSSNGFQMKQAGVSQGVLSSPVKGLIKRDDPDGGITFIVGANTQ